MLFGFISIKHVVSFVGKLARELESFAGRMESAAASKIRQADALHDQAAGHQADANQARAIAAALPKVSV